MNNQQNVFLHFSTDIKTLEIIKLLKEEVKLYIAYNNFYVLKDLISGEFLNEKSILYASAGSSFIGITFHSYINQLDMIPVSYKRGQLEMKMPSEIYLIDGNRENYYELYQKRNLLQKKIIVIDLKDFPIEQLRYLLYASFIMEWFFCEGIVFKNYESLPKNTAVDTLGLLIKGVLNDFAKQTFIFHPFRSGR